MLLIYQNMKLKLSAIYFLVLFGLLNTNHLTAQTCNSSSIVVSTNETWDVSTKGLNYVVNNDICIASGATLNITGINVLFNNYYSITVQEGAILNITNAAIKPNTGNTNWVGIIVRGNHNAKLCNESAQTLNEAQHGKLYMDNVLLEAANIGVRLLSSYDNTKSAGIININNATFYDNTFAAIYIIEQDSSSLSCRINSIANSRFVTANPSGGVPDYFIQVKNYKSLTLLGCEFEVYAPNTTLTKGIKISGLETAGIILEASEYVNPFNGENSTKLSQLKRNKFQNLERGIYFEGDTLVTPFQSIIKNCDFNQVKLAIKAIYATDIKILCNKYNAQEYTEAPILKFSVIQYTITANNDTIQRIPTIPTINPASIFVLCEDVFTNIDIVNNECNFDGDFNDTPAYGIFMLPQYYDNQGNYTIANNIFRYTGGSEGGLVTGMFFHGDYTWSPQLQNNQFYNLHRDIQLVGRARTAGTTCYLPVLGNQGIYFEGTPQEFRVCNGNIFSSPASHPQGNIASDVSLVYYTVPNGSGIPKYQPTQISSPCVGTPFVSQLYAPQNADCAVPPVSGLLSTKSRYFKTKSEVCFNLSPNPANTIARIDLEPLGQKYRYTNKTLTLYNSVLQPVYSAALSDGETEHTINLQTLPQGLYVVTLTTENGVVCSQKLIKQ